MEETYREEQLREQGLIYFRGDILATNVWISKYALKNKLGEYKELTPDDTIKRLTREIERIESKYPNSLSYNQIYEALKDFKYFIFGGSVIFGLGNDEQISSLGNCFFIDNGSDSYGGIFQLEESMVQLMKRRGGVGITLEHLRPETSLVNNAAKTSTGLVSFMDRFSNGTREVAQDGRRGALMISCHVDHPDIIKFINKKDDPTKVTGANVSVKVTDKFMEAVERDEDYYLCWPIKDKKPDIKENLPYNSLHVLEDGSHVRRVKAKEVWNNIIRQAHKNAEPGVLFWDNIIKESPADCYSHLGFTTKGTNPCVVGDTLIAVADGRNAVSIRELSEVGKDVPVYCTNPKTGRTEIKWGRNPRKTGIKKEVWKLKLDDNSELIATPDHQILTTKLVYKPLKDLTPGESIMPFYSYDSNGYRHISRTGPLMSGGDYQSRRQCHLIYEFFNGNIDDKLYSIHHEDFNFKNDRIENLKKILRSEYKSPHSNLIREEKNSYHKMDPDWKFTFTSYSGKTNSRYINVSNDELIKFGKELFRKKGRITRKDWINFAKEKGLPVKLENNFRFQSFINFKNQVSENHKVKSVEFYGYEDVYNLTVDDYHNYHIITSFSDDKFIKSSGICIKNCGEVPLSPYDSCRLGSINLYNFVEDPFTSDAKFNFTKLAKYARIAQRFMDDIVDLEEEKVINIINKIKNDPEDPEIKRNELMTWEKVLEVLKKGRRTGVGVLGLGDALAALGIRFGTPEATKLAEEIQKCIAIHSYKESVSLAKDRGHFPIWNPDLESPNPFIRRVIVDNFNNKEYKEYVEYGRRNIANLSIAPTGSLAILSQTTSGIEPVFKIYYRRRRKINPGEKNVKVSFVDQNGDSWEEYNVIHYPFIDWYIHKRKEELERKAQSSEIIEEDLSFWKVLEKLRNLPEKDLDEIVNQSPWAGSEAHTIDYIEKVNMQGAIQKWVDHSISVTHNLPEKISVDEVNKIYFQAWKAGCKGLTIYREGSRSGVLITKKEKDNNKNGFKESNAPKRPTVLESDYYYAKAKGKEFAVIIGLWPDTNRPFEVFAFENPPINKNTRGKTIKVKKGHYKFVNGEFEIDNLQLSSDSIEERTLTLTASMLLRHGAPIKYVNKVIQKIDDNITSFSSVVRRYLSRYISEEKIDGEKCPYCGSEMIMQDGCSKCINPECGYSKCG